MLLSDLPFDIIYHISLFLPTAASVASLAQTCRRLHTIINAKDSRVYRAFVSTKFPQIGTPPFWKDAARSLVSRSRALDRNAVVGRFVFPPRDAIKIGSHRTTRRDNPTLGYRPAIDSYEVWNGDRWTDRKEVLAWGAAEKLTIRISQYGSGAYEKWLIFSDLDGANSNDDICGVFLLGSNYSSERATDEHIIFGRVRGELAHLIISPDAGTHEHKRRFDVSGRTIERLDLSHGQQPTLAAYFTSGAIAFYDTTSEEPLAQPFAHMPASPGRRVRKICSRFLSPDRYVVSTGRIEDSLSIFTMSPDGFSLLRKLSAHSMDVDEHTSLNSVSYVTAVSPFATPGPKGSSEKGSVFLAAWGDPAVRLHDLRSGRPSEGTFRDSIDENPVYSILPFGHDRFAVGCGGDALVKIFDLRMPATYSYVDARAREHTAAGGNGVQIPIHSPCKDFSLYLSQPVPGTRYSHRSKAYRGPVYTLSSPSPSSSTIYAGVAGGVFRLDFVSTDDLTGPNGGWYQENLALGLKAAGTFVDRRNGVLQMAGYERPEPKPVDSFVRLRKQLPFSHIQPENIQNERLTGWDRRWKGERSR